MNKMKKGDEVVVIAGKDKGARGELLRVDNKAGRVVVESVNVVKKHQKPGPAHRMNPAMYPFVMNQWDELQQQQARNRHEWRPTENFGQPSDGRPHQNQFGIQHPSHLRSRASVIPTSVSPLKTLWLFQVVIMPNR